MKEGKKLLDIVSGKICLNIITLNYSIILIC